MKTRAWEAILSAWADVDARIAQDLPSGKGDLGGADVGTGLADLRYALAQRLAQLSLKLREIDVASMRAELAKDGGGVSAASSAQDQARLDEALKREADAEIQKIFEPLTMHIDERVLLRLPPDLSGSWERLQGDVIHSDDGGAVFYDCLDTLLASARPSELVLEVYSFCLSEGFFGRYADAPEKIQAYRDEIASRIPIPRIPIKNEPLPPPRTKVVSPYVYYGIAALVVIVIVLVARALVPSSHASMEGSHDAGSGPQIRS